MGRHNFPPGFDGTAILAPEIPVELTEPNSPGWAIDFVWDSEPGERPPLMPESDPDFVPVPPPWFTG